MPFRGNCNDFENISSWQWKWYSEIIKHKSGIGTQQELDRITAVSIIGLDGYSGKSVVVLLPLLRFLLWHPSASTIALISIVHFRVSPNHVVAGCFKKGRNERMHRAWRTRIWQEKRVSVIKRHIAVDTPGCRGGNNGVTGGKGCLMALERQYWTSQSQKTRAGSGRTGGYLPSSARGWFEEGVEIAKHDKLHCFAVLPERRVTGRSFAWPEKNGQLLEELLAQIGHPPAIYL